MHSSESLFHPQHVRATKNSRGTSASCPSPLIPGIPDDVVFDRILTKISWKCLFVLPAVSRRWREEFESRRVYKHRLSTGTNQQLLSVIHNSDRLEFALSLFNLSDKNEWLRLPRIPGVRCGVPYGCRLVFLEGILYVIGGYDFGSEFTSSSDFLRPFVPVLYEQETVYELDIAAGRGAWRTGVPLKIDIGLQDFLCKVEEDKIHLAKLSDERLVPRWEIDVYDPVLKSWTYSFDSLITRLFDVGDVEGISDDTIWDLRTGLRNMRNTRARVNGRLFSVGAEGVSVRDSFSGKWHLHSVSFRDYVKSLIPDDEPEFGNDIDCWDVVPLDGELVVTASWRSMIHRERSYDCFSGFYFVMSRGLSSREQRVTWNKIHFPDHLGWCRSIRKKGCNEKLPSLRPFSTAPQVYPCNL